MRSWPPCDLPPVSPSNVHSPLRLEDSYSGKTIALTSDEISMYVCGITPYDATHLGHAATYLTFDLINRYLLSAGAKITFSENITDIDDPLFERAIKVGTDWRSLATDQITLFTSDMTELRVLPPHSYRGVVESMDVIIDYVETMKARGLTYTLQGDLYLDLSQCPSFFEDLPLPHEEAIRIFGERGGDPFREGKRQALDPLLWRKSEANEPTWRTSFGDGRPGWHIGCVAIALSTLPDVGRSSITIQGGGSDLRFPHHYMTGIQAQALTGKSFSQLYIHCGMIGLDGEKMSKSKGNLVFVSKLIKAGVSPMAIRWALLKRPYCQEYMWLRNETDIAQTELDALKVKLGRDSVPATDNLIKAIYDFLADDLKSADAIAAINNWVGTDGHGGDANQLRAVIDGLLGIALSA